MKEHNNGQMDQNTQVSGKTTKQMAMVNCIMQMVTFTRVNGPMTRLMAEEYTHMPMELSTMESGKTTNNTVEESKLGLMELFMKVNTVMGRKMVKAN